MYEEVYVNNEAKRVTFLGVREIPGINKKISPTQPLFHVQHGTAGIENEPLNTWRIVHLTNKINYDLINHFKKFNNR